MNKCCKNCSFFKNEDEKFYCDKFDVYLENTMIEQVDSCDDFEIFEENEQ